MRAEIHSPCLLDRKHTQSIGWEYRRRPLTCIYLTSLFNNLCICIISWLISERDELMTDTLSALSASLFQSLSVLILNELWPLPCLSHPHLSISSLLKCFPFCFLFIDHAQSLDQYRSTMCCNVFNWLCVECFLRVVYINKINISVELEIFFCVTRRIKKIYHKIINNCFFKSWIF